MSLRFEPATVAERRPDPDDSYIEGDSGHIGPHNLEQSTGPAGIKRAIAFRVGYQELGCQDVGGQRHPGFPPSVLVITPPSVAA